MKMRHDMVTGIVGLLTCIFFFIMTQQVRQPANLLEPGPRLLPYVAIFLIGISSTARRRSVRRLRRENKWLHIFLLYWSA